jgi:hypothetical protein
MNELPIQDITPAPKKSNKIIIIVIVVFLVLCCLCSIVGLGAGYFAYQNINLDEMFQSDNNPASVESNEEAPAAAQQETNPTSPKPGEPTKKPGIQLPKPSGVTLGEEVRFEKCGYSFKKATDLDYVLKGEGCSPAMVTTGTDEIVPPSILVTCTVNDGAQAVYDSQVKYVEENKDYSILSKNKAKVGGVEGIIWDMEIKQGEMNLRSQMFLAMVTPNQYFNISAISSTEKWEQIRPDFEAVMKSVAFFEPK